jgi:hypothetical protein
MDLIKKNYRPVSNLAFLSKVTERIAAKQMCGHLSINHLFPEFQSAYRNFHSTETALLHTRNDFLINMNKQHVTLLVFLDLSAAFDTVDHYILLRHLKYKFGICNNALAWSRSYLVNRSHCVVIENVMLDSFAMKCGVPQGSCLGPLLFILYTSKLFDVIHHHLPTVHCFADDTELYLAFNPSSDNAHNCLRDIRNWMITDRLMINDEKTEFMLIGTKAQLAKVKNITLTIGESVISPSEEPIRNLSAWFDRTLNLNHR